MRIGNGAAKGEHLRMLGLGRITIPGGVPGAGQALGESWGSCSGEPSSAQAVSLSSTSGLPAGSLNTGKAPTEGGGSTDGAFTTSSHWLGERVELLLLPGLFKINYLSHVLS